MAWIQRKWTPKSAEEWTKEDLFACIFSVLSYIMLTIGLALAIFNLWYGWVTFGAGIICTYLMFYIIDPKLRTISDAYEKKQKKYIENLDRIIRWED